MLIPSAAGSPEENWVDFMWCRCDLPQGLVVIKTDCCLADNAKRVPVPLPATCNHPKFLVYHRTSTAQMVNLSLEYERDTGHEVE